METTGTQIVPRWYDDWLIGGYAVCRFWTQPITESTPRRALRLTIKVNARDPEAKRLWGPGGGPSPGSGDWGLVNLNAALTFTAC